MNFLITLLTVFVVLQAVMIVVLFRCHLAIQDKVNELKNEGNWIRELLRGIRNELEERG